MDKLIIHQSGTMKINRDGIDLRCPKNPEEYCSNHCPAFAFYDLATTFRPGTVELSCFPTSIVFPVEIEKAP